MRSRRFHFIAFVLAVVLFLVVFWQEDSSQHVSDFSPRPSVPETNDYTQINQVVERLKSEHKPILLTVINDAYLPFAHSWLCNTIYMDIHKQIVFVVTDNRSRDELSQQWPNITVVSLSDDKLSGDQDYSHVGYVRIMIKRTKIILNLLKQKVDVFVFEVDSLWISNPIQECQRLVDEKDLAAIPVATKPNIIGGGFLYMKPTSSTILLWQKLTDMMTNLGKKIESFKVGRYISEGENDQEFLSRLIGQGYGGIQVVKLSLDKFPDGKWYTMNKKYRDGSQPFVINNNWIIGNKAKISRAKNFHHWFWNSERRSCDLDLVILSTRTY